MSQQYLGPAEEIAARLSGTGTDAGVPSRTQHKTFGDLAAVWAMLERLDVAGIIDAERPRRSDAAASVGTYISLATVNRIVAPCSKLAFADWWATTAGPRFTGLKGAMLDHRRFWDAMDCLDQDTLARIETRIGQRVQAEFDLDWSGLVVDMTNFATVVDSTNDRAPIAQRGKAKQKRFDLRLVGLALVSTGGQSSPIHPPCTTPSPGDSTRPWPKHANNSRNCRPAWPAVRPAAAGPRSKRPLPRYSNHGGCPRSSAQN
ncbi:hypothetical protein [Brooklawnia sp.]|uniref:hypothetical protein n=1 Tax=Brooklawnia sp. TaxID=2699740 RepID=UPI00311D7A42